MINKFGKLQAAMASISLLLSFAAANQVCALFAHQSELPDNVRKMRRFFLHHYTDFILSKGRNIGNGIWNELFLYKYFNYFS